ncbi:MAG TPA: hypothetical protein PKA80_07930 [Ignavibacteriaceae bacterium]|nr:hypothetical protein [Ignavibacteriaceae bacterium]
MFNKEIKFISDLSLNNIKNLGTFFTIDKLLKANLHPAITTYISSEIDYLIFQDRQKLLKDSVFDYSGKEISKYFTLISDEIKSSKRIAFEDVKRLIIQAVSFNANYIVRPRWSLTKLIFEDGSTKSFEEINLILNYVYYSSFLKKIILEYLTRRKLANLSVAEFELIISKIDRELFNTQPEKLVENALYTMADFFNIGALSKTKVNVGYVELFLKEKNHIEYLLRLNHTTAKDTRTNLEIVELKKILFSDIPLSYETEIRQQSIDPDVKESDNNELANVEQAQEAIEDVFETEHSNDTDSEKIILDEIKIIEKTNEEIIQPTELPNNTEELISDSDELDDLLKDIPARDSVEDKTLLAPEKEKALLDFFDNELETTDQNLPAIENPKAAEELFQFDDGMTLGKDFINSNSEEILNLEEIKSDETENKITTNKTAAEDILPTDEIKPASTEETTKTNNNESKIYVQEIVEPPPPPKKDLASFLSDKESKRIVSDIFNEDRDDFITTIEKIQECRSYNEATEILKTVFLSSRINPFSREAVVLTNAVSNYFNNN